MEDWKTFVEGLRNGDPDACRQFWDDFGESMKQLSDRRISPGMQRRVDSEDVVQSVCRTFFRRAHEGEFLIEDDNSLWRLLCAITVAKTRMHIRFHKRQRRDVSAERHLDDVTNDGSAAMFEPAGDSVQPDEQAEFADQFRHLVEQLDEDEKQVLELRLQQKTNDEIAEQLQCSERTVRRTINRIRQRLEDDMGSLMA